MKIVYEESDLSSGMYFVPRKALHPEKKSLSKEQRSFVVSCAYQLWYLTVKGSWGKSIWTISSIADGWTEQYPNAEDALNRINGWEYREVSRKFISMCLNY